MGLLFNKHNEEVIPAWKLEHPTWRFDHVAAGKKTAATNIHRYGKNYYEQIGRKGGKISRGGGFAANPELAVEVGRKGGSAPRRTKQQMEADNA